MARLQSDAIGRATERENNQMQFLEQYQATQKLRDRIAQLEAEVVTLTGRKVCRDTITYAARSFVGGSIKESALRAVVVNLTDAEEWPADTIQGKERDATD